MPSTVLVEVTSLNIEVVPVPDHLSWVIIEMTRVVIRWMGGCSIVVAVPSRITGVEAVIVPGVAV